MVIQKRRWHGSRRGFLKSGAAAGLCTLVAAPHIWVPRPVAARGAGFGRARHLIFIRLSGGFRFTAAFNGAGAVWTPTIINLFCFWFWEIPLAWVLAFPLGFGPNGVFTAIAVAFSTLAVVSGVLFKRGKWKEAAV